MNKGVISLRGIAVAKDLAAVEGAARNESAAADGGVAPFKDATGAAHVVSTGGIEAATPAIHPAKAADGVGAATTVTHLA